VKRLDSHSQNLLRSPRLVRELIGHSTIKKTDTVIDIGAGSGIISYSLSPRCKNVISYELDPRMIKKLQENLADCDNVTIVQENFLEAELPTSPYKIFANIPFHLSSPILKKLTESPRRPQAISLIVQKQFGNKLLIDKEGFTGMLGAQVAPMYTARVRQRLQKSDYSPPPAVDTVLVELLRRDQQLVPEKRLEAYREFIANCFADPKVFLKMPLNELSNAIGKKPSELSTDQWVELFKKQQRY
jgi:23S rRNA (adenine-N6)-dimethyltransferase